jgi:poly(hydroxyalkanoate) depolymerase family esterase
MHDLRSVLARLGTLRSKFERLLASARKKAARAPDYRPGRLRELTGFGANPGDLRMFAYVPEHLPSNAPLVIALHGCTQTADEYDRGTGWSSLADRFGFAIVYPQQQPVNNPKSCFSWFLPGDITRGHGEALSIKQMVEHAVRTFGADASKVFVTGLSAGGAMASVMLATYPELFAGGAIIARLPYGCARNVQQAFEAMFAEDAHPAQALGDRVRAASSHRGPWPKISVWHGTGDQIVKSSNGEAIIRQWTNLHGLSETPSYQEVIGSHTHRVWSDAHGNALIEAFSINGMSHGVPLGTTAGGESCGAAGAFFLDVGISSTHHIARFWGLHASVVEKPRPVALASAPPALPAEQGACLTREARRETSHSCRRFDCRGRRAAAATLRPQSERRHRGGLQGRGTPCSSPNAVGRHNPCRTRADHCGRVEGRRLGAELIFGKRSLVAEQCNSELSRRNVVPRLKTRMTCPPHCATRARPRRHGNCRP